MKDDFNREKFRAELESAKVRLAVFEKERRKIEADLNENSRKIEEVKRDIRSLAQLSGESEDIALGLSDACREVFRRTDRTLTQAEVKKRLEEIDFPIGEHKHAIASIGKTLKRLYIAGEIEPVELPNGRTAYRSKRKPA
ncbi:MAG TPA: hypothetical protein VLR90_01865 [Blastocatellia bacterium]|nr:hypothetical protein [Blastocatellia bacterium]